ASGSNHQPLDVALYDASGNQLGLSGTPVRTDPVGTTTQPVKIVKVAAGPVPTAVSVGTSATQLPSSPLSGRVSLCITNNSAVTIYVGGSSVTTSNGTPVSPTGSFCDDVGSQLYYAIVATGTADVRVLEN